MNNKKSYLLVLVLLAVAQIAALNLRHSVLATASPSASQKTKKRPETYGPPTQLAVLKDKAVKESSGLTASRRTPGVYWTHNDSGDGPFIYALDTKGVSRGTWRVAGANAIDWEDMAAGPGPTPGTSYLYIGDIGDNQQRRNEIVVYRVPEPSLTLPTAAKGKPSLTPAADIIRLKYPDGAHDAEALLVHPSNGTMYIVTKTMLASPGIYEAAAPLNVSGVSTMTHIGNLEVPSIFGGIITGGAISPDGRRVAFCDYMQGYEATLAGKEQFASIWKKPLRTISLGKRSQGESITYRLDSKALLMTSEGSPMPLTQVVRR